MSFSLLLKRLAVPSLLMVTMAPSSPGQELDPSWLGLFRGTTWGSQTYILSMARDAAANTFVLGESDGAVDLDPGPGVVSAGSQNGHVAFVFKLDTAHVPVAVWQQTLITVRNMSVSGSGEVYISGTTGYQAFDFDPGPGEIMFAQGASYFIAKFTNDLELVWAKQFLTGGGNCTELPNEGTISMPEAGRCMTVLQNGNVALVGWFCANDVDFDPGPDTLALLADQPGSDGSFLWMLDADGELVWVRPVTGTRVRALTSDEDSRLYVTLAFTSSWYDIYPDHTDSSVVLLASENEEFRLVCYDADGHVLWHEGWNYHYSSTPRNRVVAGSDGYLYLNFEGAPLNNDFDPGPGLAAVDNSIFGGEHHYIVQLDEAGGFHQVWPIENMSYNHICDILPLPDGRVFLSGAAEDSTDWDPGPGVQMVNFPRQTGIIVELLPDGSFQALLPMYPGPEGSSVCTKLWNAGDHLVAVGTFNDNCSFGTLVASDSQLALREGFILDLPYEPFSVGLPEPSPMSRPAFVVHGDALDLTPLAVNCGVASRFGLCDAFGRAVAIPPVSTSRVLAVSSLANGLYHLQVSCADDRTSVPLLLLRP